MKQEQFATVFEELGLTSDQIDEYMEHWKVGLGFGIQLSWSWILGSDCHWQLGVNGRLWC